MFEKEIRLRLKALLCVLGIALLFALLYIGIKNTVIRQPEGETARVQDVRILVTALNAEFDKTRIYEELSQALSEDPDSRLTYGEYQEIVSFFHPEEVSAILPDYHKKYKAEFFFLKEDWQEAYEKLLEQFDEERIINRKEVFILGLPEDVKGTDGAELEKGSLLTVDGVSPYLSDLFEQYRIRRVEVYEKAGTLLTVRRELTQPYTVRNAWVMEIDGRQVRIFYNGWETAFDFADGIPENREQVADLEFREGKLGRVTAKTEKINGKLLSMQEADEDLAAQTGAEPGALCLTIEGYGVYACEPDCKVYKLYGSLEQYTDKDLRIGYDFTDFVLDQGKICAGLVTREETMKNIRVVIKRTDYAGAYHEEIELTADTGFTVEYGKYGDRRTENHAPGEIVTIDRDSEYLKGDRVKVLPEALTGRIKLLSVERSQGDPSYRGMFELEETKSGIVIVNELLLEEYLYSVIPSEMPASYPQEALKAQAVCARTYAYRNMLHSGLAYLGAHVDDSAGYQVYNNISENVETTRAVRETTGEILEYEGEPAGCYYYSTSCGFGSDTSVWHSGSAEDTSYMRSKRIGADDGAYTGENLRQEEIFREFISQSFSEDYESGEGWYRWTYTVEELEPKILTALLQKRYAANEKQVLTLNEDGEYESLPIEEIGEVKEIYAKARTVGGCMDELVIETKDRTYKVLSELNIRYVLNDGIAKVVRQDGSDIASPSLLPSAFFTITTSKKDDHVIGYTLTGGGFGHGAGMSQNGARSMAKTGWAYQDILDFFYESCRTNQVYEAEE